MTQLYVGLHLFFLNAAVDAIAKTLIPDVDEDRSLLHERKTRADNVGEFAIGFTRLLYLRHSRQQHPVNAPAALFAIAGPLFRGQD